LSVFFFDIFRKIIIKPKFNLMKVFITNANSKGIIELKQSKEFIEKYEIKGIVYKKPIYFLSDFEKKRLLLYKDLLENTEAFIRFYKKVQASTSQYLIPVKNPRYHQYRDCEALNSDFRNYKVPQQIRVKGKSKEEEFRLWFQANQHLLNDKKEIFELRLKSKFNLFLSDLPHVLERNSGITIFRDISLLDLEAEIDDILRETGRFFRESSEPKKTAIRRFQKYTYLSNSKYKIYNNDTGLEEKELREFLHSYNVKFKQPIIDLLHKYYRVLYNPELKFESTLLEELGFSQCFSCEKRAFDEINL